MCFINENEKYIQGAGYIRFLFVVGDCGFETMMKKNLIAAIHCQQGRKNN